VNTLLKIIFVSALFFIVLAARNLSGEGSLRTISSSPSYAAIVQPTLNTSRPSPPAVLSNETALHTNPIGASVFKKIDTAPVPDVHAEIFGVWDLESGELYAEKTTSVRWPLASLTKLMTAVVALTHISMDTVVEVSSSSFPQQEEESMFPLPQGKYHVPELLGAMLVGSRNEAAEALAQLYGRREFIDAMNTQASVWGMHRTYFEEPTGLSIVNQSAADEIYKMVQRIFFEFPEVFEMTRSTEFALHPESGEPITIKSTNVFVGRDDFLGGKTGYIDASQGNLVSIFRYEERPLVLIVLGAEDRFGATEALYRWFTENYSRH